VTITGTDQAARIMELTDRCAYLLCLLQAVKADACGGNLDEDLRAEIDKALEGGVGAPGVPPSAAAGIQRD